MTHRILCLLQLIMLLAGLDARAQTNWELSSARATTVVRSHISSGLDPEKCRASGFAETRPELPNRDSKGVALPENQAANRRVVVLVRR